VLQPAHWYEMEITVAGDLYTVGLRDTQNLGAFQQTTSSRSLQANTRSGSDPRG